MAFCQEKAEKATQRVIVVLLHSVQFLFSLVVCVYSFSQFASRNGRLMFCKCRYCYFTFVESTVFQIVFCSASLCLWTILEDKLSSATAYIDVNNYDFILKKRVHSVSLRTSSVYVLSAFLFLFFTSRTPPTWPRLSASFVLSSLFHLILRSPIGKRRREHALFPIWQPPLANFEYFLPSFHKF